MEELLLVTAPRLFLVMVRVSGFFITVPLLSSKSLPVQARLALAVTTAFLIFPSLSLEKMIIPIQVIPLAGLIVLELMLGIILGFLATIMTEGFRLAGQMIGLQLGFGMVSVLDPESLIQESLMDMFFFFIFILIFLSMDGDHIFLGAMSDSFHLIPVGQLIYPVKLFQDILIKSVVMFVIAMKIAFPMLGPLMIVTTVLGIISKAVPKMEVFLISFPLKIFLGFIMIIILLPILPWFIDGILIEMDRWIYQVLEMLA